MTAFPEIEEWMQAEACGEMVPNPEGHPCQHCGDEAPAELSRLDGKCWPCIRYLYGHDKGEYDALQRLSENLEEAWEPMTRWLPGGPR